MEIKVSDLKQVHNIEQQVSKPETSGDFKFTLMSSIEDAGLQQRLAIMMEEKMCIRDRV